MTIKKDITAALTVSFLTIAAGAAFGVWTGVGSSLGILSMSVASIVGVVFGVAIMKIEAFEAFRGNIAAWALIGFGLAYFIWGIRRAIKNKPHSHSHMHKGDDAVD